MRASRAALHEHTDVVRWIRADVTQYQPDRRWGLWRDRAVFHFLVDEEARTAYRSVAASAVEPGGMLIVATFGPDGPDTCSGIDVRRYAVTALAAQFAPDFGLVEGRRLVPAAAVGDQRPYVGVALRRVG